MVVIVLFVLTANLLLDRPVIESLLFAVALAVGLSPELLPAIISVTLSAGARAMSKRGVIVRRLDAIENLGSMDILCTDKTGTLTKGINRAQRRSGCRETGHRILSDGSPFSTRPSKPGSRTRLTRRSWRQARAPD